MKVTAKEVIGFVSVKMGISNEDAQRALCITDREMLIELESASDKQRHQRVIGHDLDTKKLI